MPEKYKTAKEIQDEAEAERQLNYRKSIADRIKWSVQKPSAEEKAREEVLKEEREERGRGHGP